MAPLEGAFRPEVREAGCWAGASVPTRADRWKPARFHGGISCGIICAVNDYPIQQWWDREGETIELAQFRFDDGVVVHGQGFILVFEEGPGVGRVYLFFGPRGESRGRRLSEGEAQRLWNMMRPEFAEQREGRKD